MSRSGEQGSHLSARESNDTWLARELYARQSSLLETYRARLIDQGNPLGRNPEAWVTCEEQARHILAECRYAMDNGAEAPMEPRHTLKTRRIGGARVSQGISPIHSVRAGALLFHLTMDYLIRITDERPGAERLLLKALPAVQSSITRRLEEGAIGHDLFLLDIVRDTSKRSRTNMSREIHDRIGSAASLTLRQLELYELTHNVSSDTDPRLGSLKQAIMETLDATRDIVSDLRTRTDTMRSLQVALTTFVAAMALDSPTVDIQVDDPEDLLPQTVGEEMYLMLRECLRNAFAHARASHVAIAVRIDPRQVWASVKDDGTGFIPELRQGHGLASLEERARMLSGRLTIDSAPGTGTAIELSIPIEQEGHVRDDRRPHGA
ncbi:ATP-binding protein [Streptomyces sp. NPDC126510]|uniref:sensor histidine kinase n=1 Tax=Streptomyces sp. NPDC126510 TaxID=3155317 RepID=UPI00331A93DD